MLAHTYLGNLVEKGDLLESRGGFTRESEGEICLRGMGSWTIYKSEREGLLSGLTGCQDLASRLSRLIVERERYWTLSNPVWCGHLINRKHREKGRCEALICQLTHHGTNGVIGGLSSRCCEERDRCMTLLQPLQYDHLI